MLAMLILVAGIIDIRSPLFRSKVSPVQPAPALIPEIEHTPTEWYENQSDGTKLSPLFSALEQYAVRYAKERGGPALVELGKKMRTEPLFTNGYYLAFTVFDHSTNMYGITLYAHTNETSIRTGGFVDAIATRQSVLMFQSE